jgi:hypothetical protein
MHVVSSACTEGEWESREVGKFAGKENNILILMCCAGMEPVRRVVGAGRNTLRSPKDLANYIPGTRNRVIDHVSYHLAQGYPEPRFI